MNIKEFTKKNSTKIIIVLAVIVIAAGAFIGAALFSRGPDLDLITDAVSEKVKPILAEVQKSQARQAALLIGQKSLIKELTGIRAELLDSKNATQELKNTLSDRPAPVDPGSFVDLQECQVKYKELKETYAFCLQWGEKQEDSLNLFETASFNLDSQNAVLNGIIQELNNQVNKAREMNAIFKAGMLEVKKAAKKSRLFGNIKRAALGGIIITAAVFAVRALVKK